jgi:hypothetical protein
VRLRFLLLRQQRPAFRDRPIGSFEKSDLSLDLVKTRLDLSGPLDYRPLPPPGVPGRFKPLDAP